MARKNNTNRGRSNRVMNVRIADPVAGLDGSRVDRQISALKTSESQTRVLIGAVLDVGIPTADTSAVYGFDSIFATDDFASLIQQYNLFRVKSIKFDIYDVNPNVPTYNTWGVWHDNYEGPVPNYTRENIADLPDSRVVSPGTGQTTLYWNAHGFAENQFQAAGSAGSPAQRFGGLRYFISGGAAVNKYIVHVHAVVDFRGRR